MRWDEPRKLLGKDLFQFLQLRFRSPCLKDSLTQRSPARSPKLIDLYQLVASLADRRIEEGRGPIDLEVNDDEASLQTGVDNFGARRRAFEHSALRPVNGAAIRAGVGSELVFMEVHHQVSPAAGQDAFESMGNVVLDVGKRFDQSRECGRPGRNRPD